jgi:AcrR family transcriptional regulator
MAFEKLEATKQNKIIDAAFEAFARHGYKKASMKDIAEAAGISKSVLFKYFSTKENLYISIFRLASDSIREADKTARAEAADGADLFALMRLSAKSRLSLFKNYPWLYRFSYTAAFDTDPFVRDLVSKELRPPGAAAGAENSGSRGLRRDISTTDALQVVYWVSQGYLEEKLLGDDTEPGQLVKGYEAWIDILEKMLTGGEVNER